jgi:hypothetical protein
VVVEGGHYMKLGDRPLIVSRCQILGLGRRMEPICDWAVAS